MKLTKTPALGDCPAHSPAFTITLPSHSSQHPHSLCLFLCRHHCIITYITLRSPLHLSQLCDFPSLWSNDRATILAPFPRIHLPTGFLQLTIFTCWLWSAGWAVHRLASSAADVVVDARPSHPCSLMGQRRVNVAADPKRCAARNICCMPRTVCVVHTLCRCSQSLFLGLWWWCLWSWMFG